MKKYLFIALASLTVCGACSKKEQPADLSALEAWVTDESLPVPIEFGVGDLCRIETKAEGNVTTMEDETFAFVATDNFASVTSATALYDADSRYAVGGDEHLLMNGAHAKSVSDAVVFLSSSSSAVTRYYPMPGGAAPTHLNYSFYAYRTTKDGTEPALTMGGGGSLTTTIDFELNPANNNVDVLWAKSQATARTYSAVTYNGFNAEYIRQLKSHSEYETYKPSLNFSHSASWIRFIIKAETAEAETSFGKVVGDGDTQNLTISDIYISNVRTDVRFDVSDGTLSEVGFHSPADANTKYLIEGGVATKPTYAGVEYGSGAFVAPSDRTGDPYEISFTVTDKKGRSITRTGTLALPVGNEYLPNTFYKYTIVVKSYESLEIFTSLTPVSDYGSLLEGVIVG